MAIDTVAKRHSVLIAYLPTYLRTVIPDDTVDQGDRQTIGLSYGGILAIAAVPVSVPGQFFYGNTGVNLVFSEASPAGMYFTGDGVAERTIRLEDHRG